MRSDLAVSLRRTIFPADRGKLLAYADAEHLTDDIRGVLESLPASVEFHSIEQLWDEYADHPDATRF